MHDQAVPRLPETIAEFLARTGNLLIHLLDGCNLSCSHCYLDASSGGNQLLHIKTVMDLLDEAHNLGVKSVQLSGGEPLMYPHILDVLESCQSKAFATVLSTNATLLNKDHLLLLKHINARIVTSVDGPGSYHDVFRNSPGCFHKTENAIARLVKQGLEVKIVVTICTDNFDFVPWLASWANNAGAQELQFQPLERIGRGFELRKKTLGHEFLSNLFIKLNDMAVYYSNKGLKISMTYKSRARMLKHPCTAFVCNGKKCHRKVQKELKQLVIRENGDILPELVDIHRRFAAGNIYSDSLENNLASYLDDGYAQFDDFCRRVYAEVVPDYPCPLIPWNEILTLKSKELY
ncbi:MAG: radical SAM protein [Desulfobacteraceae bacterium]|nr:radical SAM protein [Desulfobacteraceae bacterium]